MSLRNYTRKTHTALWLQLPATAPGRPRERREPPAPKSRPPCPRPSQAKPGAKAKALAKPRKRVRALSPGLARERRLDSQEVRRWKVGRLCACSGELDWAGRPVCRMGRHLCEDRHHVRGRLGPLLRDQRYWLPVCRQAHRWIEAHRAEAKARGWLAGPWNTVPKTVEKRACKTNCKTQ